jgi:hypothetical protein
LPSKVFGPAGAKIYSCVNERTGTSYSSVCGTLVRIGTDRKSGRVRVVKTYSAFECGPPHGQSFVKKIVVR